MKAVLEFNLDDHDDETAYTRCVKAKDMALAIWDIEQYLRGKTKHAPDSMSDKTYKELQEVRQKFYLILNEYNIDTDELLN